MEKKYNLETFINAKKSKAFIVHNRSRISKDVSFNYDDSFIGLPTVLIKKIIINLYDFNLNNLDLLGSEYNELRLLGWAILVKNFENIHNFKKDILSNIKNFNNYNDCDFASIIISSFIIKKYNTLELVNIGYNILNFAKSDWEYRFILMFSNELIENNNYNYPLDIIERFLVFNQPRLSRPICKILLKIKNKNPNLFFTFMKEHKNNINQDIKNYFNL